jgi:hypothetical protein
MASVEEHIHIPASPDEVWRTVRDFGAIDEYVPPITSATLSGEGVGAERTLTLADGGQVVERLDAVDDEGRTLRYSIVDGPLPVTDYDGRLSVEAVDASSCEVTWASTFTVVDAPADEIAATFAELYAAGLAGLQDRYDGHST